MRANVLMVAMISINFLVVKESPAYCASGLVYVHGQLITSLNWSHNGSKNYTVDSLSQNRCRRPLTNCHTAETAGK